MGYDLTDEYLAEARQRAYRYQGQWTGTAGALAADVARLLIERKTMTEFLTERESRVTSGCCNGGKMPTATSEGPALSGDSLLKEQHDVHPTSQAFYDLCDGIKEMHRRKSADYGCPSGTDPLANIRNGAKFVGIPAWKGAMVRLSDKVTRLATYNVTGRLENESLEDNLFDLASYSLLALLLHREEADG